MIHGLLRVIFGSCTGYDRFDLVQHCYMIYISCYVLIVVRFDIPSHLFQIPPR